MRYTFKTMIKAVSSAYTGGGLESTVRAMGLRRPARLVNMYLCGESSEYIIAACLSLDVIGF